MHQCRPTAIQWCRSVSYKSVPKCPGSEVSRELSLEGQILFCPSQHLHFICCQSPHLTTLIFISKNHQSFISSFQYASSSLLFGFWNQLPVPLHQPHPNQSHSCSFHFICTISSFLSSSLIHYHCPLLLFFTPDSKATSSTKILPTVDCWCLSPFWLP